MAEKTKHRLEAIIWEVDATNQIPEGAVVTSPTVVITDEDVVDVTAEFVPLVTFDDETKIFRVTLQEAADALDPATAQAAGVYPMRLRALVDGQPAEFLWRDTRTGRERPLRLLVIDDADPDAP